jgi:ATP-dependent Lon protease
MLISNFDQKKDESLKKLDEIRDSLAERDIVLEVTVNSTLHDREIRLNSGWTIKIGRGLDIYQKSKSNFRFSCQH